MALPTILVDSATGSDTAASGAGPATAQTGTNASFSAATVTLNNSPDSPDLSGVATDGSHVLYMVTSTGVRFFKITAKSGNVSVDVTPNPAGTSTGRTWAIGGKRATVGSTTSKLLFDNGGAAGDMGAGWIIEMASGHTESMSADWDLRRSGDTTDGPVVIRGAAGAATRPVITSSARIVPRNAYQWLIDFDLTASGGATDGIITVTTGGFRCQGLKVNGFSTANITIQNGQPGQSIVGCRLIGGGHGISLNSGCQDATIIGNHISGGTGRGIYSGTGHALTGLLIANNIIYDHDSDGIYLVQTRSDTYAGVAILGNTIDACGGDGIDYTGDYDSHGALTIVNNILSNNSNYGLRVDGTLEKLNARGTIIINNNTFNNTSGAYRLGGVDKTAGNLTGDPGLNPTYTAASSGDFSIGTNLKALGYPIGASDYVGGPVGTTRSYVDIGAAQRQEPAGGGTTNVFCVSD